MTLERWEYGNPENVADRRQREAIRSEKECGQCEHKKVIEWKGNLVNFCEVKNREYGTRCNFFKIRKIK